MIVKKVRLRDSSRPETRRATLPRQASFRWVQGRSYWGWIFSGSLLLTSSLSTAGDWPHFLGPHHNLRVEARDAEIVWPEGGFQKEWEFSKGRGWACPVVSGGSVLVFHRQGDEEVLNCLDAASGTERWHFSYKAPYRDRYGASDGPRTSPVIHSGSVYLFGVTGLMHCLDLDSGKVNWRRDLKSDYGMQNNFFGHGSTPLVFDGKVIQPIGGRDEDCVVALDAGTGKQLWITKHPWGAGYASAVPANVAGRALVLLYTGGETRPPTGGLLCIDAESGRVLGQIEHRARIAESVNASSPVMVGRNRVFVTEGYGAGGVLAEISPVGGLSRTWETAKLGSQFATPIFREGMILGSDGQNARLSELVCLDSETGKELWREDFGGRFGRCNLVDLGERGVIALGEFGELARLEVSREKCEVVRRQQLFEAPESWTVPVVASGKLFVSQNERGRDGSGPRIVCYGARSVR